MTFLTSARAPLVAAVAVVLVLAHMCMAHNAAAATGKPAPTARIYIGYCPTYFTGALAVVDVDTRSGKWTIVGHSKLPSGVFGCVADYDPVFASDPNNDDVMVMDFTEDTGYFVRIESDAATKVVNATAFNSRSEFFTGFLNFKVRDSRNVYEGMTGTVTQDGFCSDGCIGYGIQNLSGSQRERSRPLPFKAIADDTSYLDRQRNVFYVQASHDLRSTPCAPQSYQDCLLAIDANTGALLRSTYNHDEHVYRFGSGATPLAAARHRQAHGHRMAKQAAPPLIVDAFVVGMNKRCNRSKDATSYAFATVDLPTSTFNLISCVSSSVVIDEAPWVAQFSPDSTVFATASGNGNGDDPQFLSFETASGKELLNTKLAGLARALDAKMGLIFVWAVTVRN